MSSENHKILHRKSPGIAAKVSYKVGEYIKHKSLTTLLTGGIFPVPSIANPLINKIRYSSTSLEPGIGSPIYCDLLCGLAEHSGIYIGDFKVIQLNGCGLIEVVDLIKFTDHISTTSRDIFFPLDKASSIPIEFDEACENAFDKVGETKKYNVAFNNCHKFTSGCLTGDFAQNNQLLDFMKCTTEEVYGKPIEWCRWDWEWQIGE
ncbi:TPA: lecithin retinol acyltransferase family protein [Bacillus tropicus]